MAVVKVYSIWLPGQVKVLVFLIIHKLSGIYIK